MLAYCKRGQEDVMLGRQTSKYCLGVLQNIGKENRRISKEREL
jgi:hypothetical protein